MGRKKNLAKKGEGFFSVNVAATLQTWQGEYLNSGNSLNGIDNKTVRTWNLDYCNLCLHMYVFFSVKFIYSEKATKDCEIFTLILTGTT